MVSVIDMSDPAKMSRFYFADRVREILSLDGLLGHLSTLVKWLHLKPAISLLENIALVSDASNVLPLA